MPIVVKHQAAGIAPSPENPRLKYGMMMTMQQQRADQEMRQRAQDAQYDMQRMGMMAQNQVPRQPSLGEETAMLDQEIRSGMYDPDTVKALRDDERAMRLILRDRNIDATQRAQALENIQSRMRMARSTGKVQPPMMQQMPQATAVPLQQKPPMTEAEHFAIPENYKEDRMVASQQLEAKNLPLTDENIHNQMHNNWVNKQKFLQNPGGFGQPQGQGQQAPATSTPSNQPQASVPQAMSSNPLSNLANAMQQSNGNQTNPVQGGMVNDPYRLIGQGPVNPKGVKSVLQSMPPQYVLNDGTRVGSKWENGQWVPDIDQTGVRSAMANDRWGAREFGVENVLATPASPPIPGVATGASLPPQYQNAIYTAEMQERDRRNPPIQPIPNAVPGSPGNYLQYASQPQRSANMVYTAEDQERIRKMPPSEITPNWATGTQFETVPYLSQSAQQQQPMYPMEATGGIGVGPSYMAQPDSGFASARTFTSADGRSMVGSVVGINPPSSNGGFSTVQIRKESDGKVYDVPLNNLSQQDQQYVLSGGNQDTMYDLQNQNRSAGTNFMDPNNPVRQQMSAADQSIVNPQKQTLGQAGGRYGLGIVDYGINPATGNRVTASIRPGSTMPEYDPPGPTKEQVESDDAAKEKQKEFNERVRKNQGKSTGKKTLVAGGANTQGGQMQTDAPQDAPALTQLLATMTPSQRRDYSKWLMEEPDRYAMRNQIAQQQLNRTATAAAGSGQLPAYPGLQKRIQERNQQQGGAPMQGQMPMQGNLGQQSPPVEMGIDQALAIAKNPNASPEDQKRAAEIMVKNGITTVDQAKEVIGRVASPSVTDQGDILDPNDPLYQNKRGAVSSQKPPAVKTPVQPAKPKQEEPTNTFMGRDVSNFKPRGWGDVPPAAPASPVTKPKPKATLRPMIGLSDEEKSRVAGNEKPLDIKRQTKVPVGQSPTMAQLEGGRGSTVNEEFSDAQMETRTWTSADGKKTFEGSLAGLSYDNVTGRRIAIINSTGGQVFKIPIESFSEDDQSRLLAASAIEKATDRQSSDYSKYGVKIGVGEKYIAPKTSSKSRPSKGSGRGTSTDPSSKWPEEVIRSIPETTARKAKRTS